MCQWWQWTWKCKHTLFKIERCTPNAMEVQDNTFSPGKGCGNREYHSTAAVPFQGSHEFCCSAQCCVKKVDQAKQDILNLETAVRAPHDNFCVDASTWRPALYNRTEIASDIRDKRQNFVNVLNYHKTTCIPELMAGYGHPAKKSKGRGGPDFPESRFEVLLRQLAQRWQVQAGTPLRDPFYEEGLWK